MTYDDIVAAFLTADAAVDVAVPVLPDTPARRLRDALEPIATQGWWGRPVNERLSALGLGFFEGYVWGRAAALGDVQPAVVAATFGVFEPSLIGGVYERGRRAAPRHAVLAAREAGAVAILEDVVSAVDADSLAGLLLDAIGPLDGLGRPLFSALRALPLPRSPHGRLWRAAELAREHRGDGHLAAAATTGFDAVELNVLTELWLGYPFATYSATRGFAADRLADGLASLESRGWVAGGALTGDGRSARDVLEHATDASQHTLVARLGDGLERVVETAASISDLLIANAAFPPDARKRAAG